MKTIFEPTKGMLPVDTSYCPGCSHGIAHRLIMEVLEERGDLGRTIGVVPIGCSINAHNFMNIDMCESTHGRAPAIATGIRRVHPDKVVFTYQGDGDLASIGAGEIVHAAHRGEKFTTFFINNAIYGMTGGQMAPTTLIGQRATTAVDGRTVEQAGLPLRVCEMLATIPGAVFVERVILNTPANVRKAKKVIEKAFDIQEARLGFTFIEFLSACPTNWGMSPEDALKWVASDMAEYYPVQNFRTPEGF
ncbi:MAG: thiamine pyrophosphate-dependent enzyme [Lachnospiraceae bacterium]|nr:thiamine pyrophosphate-dependent enzyme [Lachnospiraceae bacterium]MCQ2530324.1 thiamine pyrophosphate-dependent enzyme [Lachnospiraceae bacterium]